MEYMVRTTFFTLFIFTMVFTARSEPIILTTENADWSILEGEQSEEYPATGNWQLKKFKEPLINFPFNASAPSLKNFEVHNKAFPNMMDIIIGPPSEGIYRVDEKELTRYVEFINEIAYETDNNLEYILPLEGQWGLDKQFKSKDFLFQFISGSDTWIDIIAGNKLLGSGKGKIILRGDKFPNEGQAVIKTSSIDTNNKGLINVKIFKSYEMLVQDPFRKALVEKWYEKPASLKWKIPTDQTVKQSPWLPELTPALYKRIYVCRSKESTKGIHFSASEDISHIWINGKMLDMNSTAIPDGLFKEGENEVIYYASQTSTGLDLNLLFSPARPNWVKTEVTATKDSVVTGLVRGVDSKVFVNGKYAGLLRKEKTDEYLGYGLFKDGKNEIAVCVIQNNPKVFIEYLKVEKADESKAIVLPWSSNSNLLSSRAPGILSSYGSYYLQWKPGNGSFETKFYGKSAKDMELIFNSGKRFPTWMFRKDLFIPDSIEFNGKTIARKGHSFVLPAADSKDENTVRFRFIQGSLPEPLLYLSSKATPDGFFRFKQTSRSGRERLKPGVYFTGEKVSYLIDADFSAYELVKATIDGQSLEVKAGSEREISFELKSSGTHKLSFEVKKGGKSIKIAGDTFYVHDYPEDKEKWLKENRASSEILISSDAFYNSESTLFPEFHQREWMLRELKTDGSRIEFGPLSKWNDKQKFSIFDSFPNGEPVFEKFGRRMETYMKLRSRGFPVIFTFEKEKKIKNLWESAATVFQYLLWLEKKGKKVDWNLETLDEYKEKYVKSMSSEADEYMKLRISEITAMIRKLALNAAPGSTFTEVEK